MKEYLGDGAYVHFDGWHVWLTTHDGYRTTNEVALEPEALNAFLEWLDRLKAAMTANQPGEDPEEV